MPTSLGTTGKLILAFVTLLLGAVLISSIAAEGLDKTSKDAIVNEAHEFTVVAGNVSESTVYTVTNAPTSWKTADCPLTSFAIKNASGGTALTITTDYVPSLSAGTFTLVNSTATEAMVVSANPTNLTYVDYTYCPENYMNLTWGRTIINLVPGFFALAILGASLLLFYSVAKDYDII